MIAVIITFLISFILDGIISMIVPTNSILLPLFTVISLVVIYPYFKNKPLSYFIYLAIFGALYDLVYGDIYLLNVIVFALTGFIVQLLNYIPDNYLTMLLKFTITICFYRFISYIIYIVLSFNFANISLLFKGITSSLILNILYGLILYFIIGKVENKKISKNI